MERKTGSLRKSGVLRNLEKGTGPLLFFTTCFGLAGEIIGFFSLYYAFRDNRSVTLFVFSVVAPLAGAAVWNRLCKKNGWPFQTGGPEHDPYGVFAFVWGLVTALPVVFCARVLSSNYRLNSPISVLRWFSSAEFGQVMAYSALTGLAALIFYGVSPRWSLRSFLDQGEGMRESFELRITAVWAVFLSAVPVASIAFIARGRAPMPEFSLEALAYALPVGLSLSACLLLLSAYFYFFDHKRLDPKGMFRAFVVEFGFSVSVFWGLWFLMDWRRFDAVAALVERILNKPF